MRFLKVSILLVALFVVCGCPQQKKGHTDQFKTGNFSLHSEKTGLNYFIHRTDSSQIELEKETGKISKWKVNWLNDTAYTIALTDDNYGLLDKGKELNFIPSVHVKIIKRDSDYYIFEATYTPTYIITDTMRKLRYIDLPRELINSL